MQTSTKSNVIITFDSDLRQSVDRHEKKKSCFLSTTNDLTKYDANLFQSLNCPRVFIDNVIFSNDMEAVKKIVWVHILQKKIEILVESLICNRNLESGFWTVTFLAGTVLILMTYLEKQLTTGENGKT